MRSQYGVITFTAIYKKPKPDTDIQTLNINTDIMKYATHKPIFRFATRNGQ